MACKKANAFRILSADLCQSFVKLSQLFAKCSLSTLFSVFFEVYILPLDFFLGVYSNDAEEHLKQRTSPLVTRFVRVLWSEFSGELLSGHYLKLEFLDGAVRIY